MWGKKKYIYTYIYQNFITLIFQTVLGETTEILTYKTASLTENKISFQYYGNKHSFRGNSELKFVTWNGNWSILVTACLHKLENLILQNGINFIPDKNIPLFKLLIKLIF